MLRMVCVLIVFSFSQMVGAMEIEPLSVSISQMKAFRVVAITLPIKPFMQTEQYLINYWHIESLHHGLRQLCLQPVKRTKEGPLATEITVYGLIDQGQSDVIVFHPPQFLHDPSLSSFQVSVDFTSAKPAKLGEQWAQARAMQWYHLARRAEGDVLSHMIDLLEPVYGIKPFKKQYRAASNSNMVSALSLFSGETAIQETLYQKKLEHKQADSTTTYVSIDTLKGPEIKSHPYKQMLADALKQNHPHTTVPEIVTLVPENRFMVYLNDATQALPWFEQIAETGFDFSSLITGEHFERNLLERYLENLRIDRHLAEWVMQKGKIKHLVLFAPDLYFTEGTDVTIVLESIDHALLHTAVKVALGVFEATSSPGVFRYRGTGKISAHAYLAIKGRWVILSTSEKEAAMALHLASRKGSPNLGESDEFRYMMHVLPAQQERSGFYVYLSDPFIRHMIGPKTKVLQLRRSLARIHLEKLNAASLLYQLDHQKVADLETLLQYGYIKKESVDRDDIQIDIQGIISSKTYGTLRSMTSLNELSIDLVQDWEAKAYQEYQRDYSDQWRQYFDPIGIRFKSGSPWVLETVILPLIDNSLYTMVRSMLGKKPEKMRLPQLQPKPISTLSLQLNNNVRERLADTVELNTLLSWIGNNIHFALYDNNPIIAFGSGDAVDMLSSPMGIDRLNTDNLGIGFLVAMLTQPFAVFVEVFDETEFERSLNALLHSVKRNLPARQLVHLQRHVLGRHADRGWVVTFNIVGFVHLNLYLRVVDGYLIIANREFDYRIDDKSVTSEEAANAGLHFSFDAIKQMLPSLYQSFARKDRTMVKNNIRRIVPFMMAGAGNVEVAMQQHENIYGIKPSHSDGGHWLWDESRQTISSSLYGLLYEKKIPSWFDQPNQPYGVFRALKSLDLRFAFFQDGVHIKLVGQPVQKEQ